VFKNVGRGERGTARPPGTGVQARNIGTGLQDLVRETNRWVGSKSVLTARIWTEQAKHEGVEKEKPTVRSQSVERRKVGILQEGWTEKGRKD